MIHPFQMKNPAVFVIWNSNEDQWHETRKFTFVKTQAESKQAPSRFTKLLRVYVV